MKFYVEHDGQDQHGECDCGLCNANGKAYSVGLYAEESPEEAYDRAWGPSEEAAMHNAKMRVAELGGEIVERPDEEDWQMYEVSWSAPIEATSPLAAAQIAYDELQKDSGSSMTVFFVRRNGETTVIDMERGEGEIVSGNYPKTRGGTSV